MDSPAIGRRLCVLGLAGAVLCAQAPPEAKKAEPGQPPARQAGSIAGTVVNDANGAPLRRAQVLLRPAEAGNPSLFETTDEKGAFEFPKVPPGRYSMLVQRDGFLAGTAGRIGAYKMPPIFNVLEGQRIPSFVFRLVASAVVSGKVRFDDAEPAINVLIQLFREYYFRGRHGFTAAGSARTNDRGEYRVHGLEAGAYYVAAIYEPPPRPPNAEEQRRTDPSGKPLREMSYAVTFFPEVQKLADAVAVHISPGQEAAGIDIFLTQVHTVRIRGRVRSAISGQVVPGPSITLRWNDANNTGSVAAPVDVHFDRDQNFEIRGVAPGPYLIVTTGSDDGKALSGRTPVNVGEEDIAELGILIGPERKWDGRIRIEGDGEKPPSGLTVSLEPRRSTAFPSRAAVSRENDFSLSYLPQETYDLFVHGLPEDAYLKSILVANRDVLPAGLEAEPGSDPPPMEVVVSRQGGQVLGKAVTSDPMIVASGAAVLLIPDPPAGRVQSYKTGYADEYGNFLLRGIAPGSYIVVAWLEQAPCEVYNPDDLQNCRQHGAGVTIGEDGYATVQLTAN